MTEVNKVKFLFQDTKGFNRVYRAGDEIVGDTPEFAEFTPAEFQEDSTAADVPSLVSDFNDLLAKLIDAGIMQADN